jgi:ribonuclease E
VDAESAVSAPDGAEAEAGDSSSESGEAAGEGEGAESSADASEETASGRRRRRKRRRGGSADGDVTAPDDPPDTVVHVREPHSPADDVRAIKGSTRLEAKKQRRREGRESGRRRPPVITESEFLARRESVDRTMVVRQRGDRTQMAVLEDGVLVEHYVNRTTHQSYVGNVYLGKVQNVLPSMEAAFVDIGKGRNAVLYAGEVNFDASGLEGQPKRIESALKSGQSVIVQVTKDPVGHKGARLTSQISLPGRYLVYVPGASMTGISRKLPDTERNRLKHILKKVMPDNAGVIVRTAAEGAAEAELDRDVTRLAAQWETIEKKAKTASAPALLYGEPDLTIRVVRDVFNEDFSKLIVSGDEGWDVIDEYVRYVAPHLADRLSRWEGDTADAESADAADDVFASYRIDEQLAKALDRKVWLPSGGSLVIDRTEAMTVIDVNTGKFTGQGGNLEETVTRNNLEAAEEIVRQLRLRDVGGIVVIDFIDMVLESNRELMLRRLLECLARDRTKHQVAEVTSLGLVQMTRKRVGAGLLEAFSEPCECCNGRGVHITFEPAEPSHRSSAGHSVGSGSSRRSGRSGGTDTDDRSERGGRRGKRDGRSGSGSEESSSGGSSAAASAAKIAAASAVSSASAVVTEAPADIEAPAAPEIAASEAAETSPFEAPAASAARTSPPSVSAWAVSTSPADDSPVAVSVSVPSVAEPAVADPDAGKTAAPVRRTRTRAGSAVARRAETPAPPVDAASAPATEAVPATESAAATEVAPMAEAAPVTDTAPAADAIPVADAVSPAEASPQEGAQAADATEAQAVTETPASDETVVADEAVVADETVAVDEAPSAGETAAAGPANVPAVTEPGETPEITEAPEAEAAAPAPTEPAATEPAAAEPPVADLPAETAEEAEPATTQDAAPADESAPAEAPAADAAPEQDIVPAMDATPVQDEESVSADAPQADDPGDGGFLFPA